MFSGSLQRLIVQLSTAQVLERIKTHTEPERVLLPGGDLIAGMRASRRKALERVYNLHYVARLSPHAFEIEATGKQAGQMGMLKGTIVPWEGRSVIDYRFVPNRNVWITYGVALAVGTLGAIVIIPTVVAVVLGVLQYKRLRYSRQVLESFMPKLFAEVAGDSAKMLTAELVEAAHQPQEKSASERVRPPTLKASGNKPATHEPDANTRTFSDRSGSFRLTAALVDVDRRQSPPMVLLRDTQGAQHSIRLDLLCDADQRWVLHEMRHRLQPQIAANTKLAYKRLGIIMAIFLAIFLAMFAAMGCVFLIPFLQFFQELQR